ncbi:LLM class flavin-dependent oxidoreductase [Paenibacillus sp. Dod16]|uniref:LLM class flavin-dependent oxidoreductase n=1 Tax=Paenibacillus sp. Dod16 TaxID=3416392 RepID=UPI003CEA9712
MSMEQTRQFISQIPHIRDRSYIDQVVKVSKLSEKYNFDGILAFFNHHTFDPYILATYIIQHTNRITPLIAVQPYYTSPLSTAKMVQTIANLYNRKVDFNLISGSRESEINEICKELNYEDRFEKLNEFSQVVNGILRSENGFSFQGKYYSMQNLKVTPRISEELMPNFFVPSFTSFGQKISANLNGSLLIRPEPITAFLENKILNPQQENCAIRLSLIARASSNEAKSFANDHYKESLVDNVKLRMRRNSVSKNTKTLAKLSSMQRDSYCDEVYWLGGIKSGGNDPILVGDYEEVADYLLKYDQAGVRKYLFGELFSEDSFYHASQVIQCFNEKIKYVKDL